MNWLDPANWGNLSAELHKTVFQPWAKFMSVPGAMPWGDAHATQSLHDGVGQLNELVQQSMQAWAGLIKSGPAGKFGAGQFDIGTLSTVFDPAQWSRAMTSGVDAALARLTDAPTYATPTDLDRKIGQAQRLWYERAKDVGHYQTMVQAAWTRALGEFTKALNDSSAPPLDSARAILDLWLNIANRSLLQMQHQPEFLEAQRKMSRSDAEYRLAEQQLAEVYCRMHHIPTRSEMDEAQRMVHELRREIRALKRRLAENEHE